MPRRAVEAAQWDAPWGADADHLKSPDDLPPFVDRRLHILSRLILVSMWIMPQIPIRCRCCEQKAKGLNWDELSALYLIGKCEADFGYFDPETLMRAAVKYGKAVRHAVGMYRRLSLMKDEFDFEISVDETDSPTTPLEHFFIASELTRLGVRFTSLAPRFIGRFEKGVDYIGDLSALDAEMAKHAAVTAHFGTYKLSLHSGSDKFSVYPLIAKYWGERVHVKTAGTSYLEALRVLARLEPDLFNDIYTFSCQHYETDRRTYHVSAQLEKLPEHGDLPALLDDFHAREVLHVTFGSVLAQFGVTAQIRAGTPFGCIPRGAQGTLSETFTVIGLMRARWRLAF